MHSGYQPLIRQCYLPWGRGSRPLSPPAHEEEGGGDPLPEQATCWQYLEILKEGGGMTQTGNICGGPVQVGMLAQVEVEWVGD